MGKLTNLLATGLAVVQLGFIQPHKIRQPYERIVLGTMGSNGATLYLVSDEFVGPVQRTVNVYSREECLKYVRKMEERPEAEFWEAICEGFFYSEF